ncbi:MAG: hypothetical protein EPN21_12890 [Methylococcaceae bacterium]|nr:MAG: hypothetical protein EPN21_12890 [Methylococcaceae bacterium]
MPTLIRLAALLCIFALATSVGHAGVITYTLGEKVFYISSNPHATPVDVTAQLNKTTAGRGDSHLNISPNGQWLVMNGRRLLPECLDWACLVVMDRSLTQAAVVQVEGQALHPDGFSAIASSGNMIVFASAGGTHSMDLWKVVKNAAGSWGAPVSLTHDSPYAWNSQPALSGNGAKALFDCGNEPYAGAGNAICEVNTATGKVRVVLSPDAKPDGYRAGTALHHADYTDGGIVFEADWGGERLWTLAAGSQTAQLINPKHRNDNSPCALPSGEVASLWLNRRTATSSNHELKLVAPTGERRMLVTGKDISDIGIGCGAD